jgi:hypothetical protein
MLFIGDEMASASRFEYVVSAIHTPLDDEISARSKMCYFHLISLNVDRTAITVKE